MSEPFGPDDLLEGDFWPEPVRVIRVRPIGEGLQLDAVGTETKRLYSQLLLPDDLVHIRKISGGLRDLRGDPRAFFLALEAQRIRFAYQFDPLLAVNVSQIDPLPHQIDAVYFHILRRPRIRFLLADDPGAGKTIMAGLLLKELKYRGLVERTLIVVPGHLKYQWLREMKERFDERFTVVDRGVVDATWGQNIWARESQIITSMDFAKRDEVRTALAEVHWDLVIVDEAHKMAAYRYGDKTKKTQRYRLGEVLSRTSDHLLFLTATPHRGDPENFRLFLDLLEPGFFSSQELLLESVKSGDNPLFLRRLKEDLRDMYGRPLFPGRVVKTVKYRLSDPEKRLYNAVTQYVQEHYNRALATEKRNVAFALLILQRRLASSVRAARRSLERRKKRLEKLLELGEWLTKGEGIDEEALEDMEESERIRYEDEMLERLTAAETREELRREIDLLEDLIRLAKEAERAEVETKLNELRKVMEEERVRETGEKLLVFTESRDTLEYLVERFRAWGFAVTYIHGGMDLDARIRAEHEFRHQAQVMISTEAGGEGINLQFCSLMVNYDIPWNPNRLEQRMGRIHRYGQHNEVHIYNLVAVDTREGKVLEALFRKLARIREALGSDRVFDVIGEVLPGKSLRELIVEAIRGRRTLDELVTEIELIPDEEAAHRIREATAEALATRHINLQGVLVDQRKAKENRLVPEYIEAFFGKACDFLGLRCERRGDGFLRVDHVPYELRNRSRAFHSRFGEVSPEYRKVTFHRDKAREQGAEFVAPGHPLLEAVIEEVLRKGVEALRRGATFLDPRGRLEGCLVFLATEVQDGMGKTAGKRLFCVYMPSAGEPRVIHPSVLWDLEPGEPPPSHSQVDVESITERALAYLMSGPLAEFRRELEEHRKHEARIKEKYGLRSLDYLIMETDAKLTDYELRRAKGEDIPDPLILRERRRKEELLARKEALVEEIRKSTRLTPVPPQVLGIALVVPAHKRGYPRPDPGLEAIGMKVAMEYERSQGRTPRDVSAENRGYDIVSTAPDGSVRYIEVKAKATSGPILLTPNEWFMARRLAQEYWLYIVEDAQRSPRLHRIRDPAHSLRAEEVKGVVRYIVRDWRASYGAQDHEGT